MCCAEESVKKIKKEKRKSDVEAPKMKKEVDSASEETPKKKKKAKRVKTEE